MLTRKEAKRAIYKASKDDTSSPKDCIHLLCLHKLLEQIYDDHEAKMKAKDEEIERLKKAIDTSIEEIEYAIKKPQYAEVYLGNAIRFLKDNA